MKPSITATGISAALPDAHARPYLAVSLSAISSRVPASRVGPVAADLVRTCSRMAQLPVRRSR